MCRSRPTSQVSNGHAQLCSTLELLHVLLVKWQPSQGAGVVTAPETQQPNFWTGDRLSDGFTDKLIMEYLSNLVHAWNLSHLFVHP